MKKAELYAMRRNLREVEQIKDTIAKLENMRISPRAVVYGGEHVQTSPSGDVQTENIQNIDEQIQRYNEKLAAILKPIEEFEKIIAEKLTEQERRIMRGYFVLEKTWESICVDENKSWTWIMKLRKDCLAKICEDAEQEGAITITRHVQGLGQTFRIRQYMEPDGSIILTRCVRGVGTTKRTIRPGDKDYAKFMPMAQGGVKNDTKNAPHEESKDDC